MRCTCGYEHPPRHTSPEHFGARFISRYRDQNDYCVDGARVTVLDDGRHSGTDYRLQRAATQQSVKVWLYLLEMTADYLRADRSRLSLGEDWTRLNGRLLDGTVGAMAAHHAGQVVDHA